MMHFSIIHCTYWTPLCPCSTGKSPCAFNQRIVRRGNQRRNGVNLVQIRGSWIRSQNFSISSEKFFGFLPIFQAKNSDDLFLQLKKLSFLPRNIFFHHLHLYS